MHYYVYTLAYPDGVVFYVGKGSGKRIADHEKEALRGHTCPKCELIRSIWREGGTVQRAIVFETDDEQAALAHEMALINCVVIPVPPQNTTQACSACGAPLETPKTLNDRVHRCGNCGYAADRDLNAAIPIKRLGLSRQALTLPVGEVVCAAGCFGRWQITSLEIAARDPSSMHEEAAVQSMHLPLTRMVESPARRTEA